ncbi:S-adenosyl-L-methionine-dependent methyltransferase [Gaertneriomyces semiglobifer]|nr:S-adenosyl-L-methionine-dependent methyltransferase [Gaertneriomyces semiglobifer]
MDPLLVQENLIDQQWFVINPDVPESFFNTLIAMYRIIDKKLYKSHYTTLQDYLAQRWNLSEAQGRNFGRAGRVLILFRESGIRSDALPTNVALLLAVKKVSEQEDRTYAETWTKAVQFFGGRCNVVASQVNLAFEKPIPTPLVTQLEKTVSTRTDNHLPSPESEPEAPRSLRKHARVEYHETEDLSTDKEYCHSNTPSNVPSKNVQAQLRILQTPDWLYTKIESFAYPHSMNPLNTQHWEQSDIAYIAISHGCMELWQRVYQEMQNGNIKAVVALSPLEPTEDWCKLLFSTGMIGILHRPINNDKRQSYFICYLDSDETYPLTTKFRENFSHISFIPNATARICKVPHSAPTIRYLSLFSGIGTGEYAIPKVFPDAICVGFSEIDPSAIKVYQTHFPTHVNFGDISKIDVSTIPPYDLLIGGSCCQSFSPMRQHKKHLPKNFHDERGQLFFEFIRILNGTKPKYSLFENVRMNSDSQETISSAMRMNPIQLNAKEFSAQKRPRLYWCNWFVPKPSPKSTPRIEDIIEKNVKTPIAQRSYLSIAAPPGVYCSLSRDFATREIALLKDGKCKALLYSDSYEQMVCCDGVYRFLTKIERCRLQGLPDDWMNVKLTKTDVGRLLGNSFQADVISYILSHLK